MEKQQQYEEAKAKLLGKIVPAEPPASCCCLRGFKCCLFYAFCCCCCLPAQRANTRENYMRRFQKWMNVSSS